MSLCNGISRILFRKLNFKGSENFLKNIPNIGKKCYIPLVPAFLVHRLCLIVLTSVSNFIYLNVSKFLVYFKDIYLSF